MILLFLFFFFFNDTATTEIYTLSLHDALPILLGAADARCAGLGAARLGRGRERRAGGFYARHDAQASRSEEHTSELQSLAYLVCRLLLEKKKEELETRHAIVGNAITP